MYYVYLRLIQYIVLHVILTSEIKLLQTLSSHSRRSIRTEGSLSASSFSHMSDEGVTFIFIRLLVVKTWVASGRCSKGIEIDTGACAPRLPIYSRISCRSLVAAYLVYLFQCDAHRGNRRWLSHFPYNYCLFRRTYLYKQLSL